MVPAMGDRPSTVDALKQLEQESRVKKSATRERDTLTKILGIGTVFAGLYLAYLELFVKHAH
jgi:predicted flap endonuclease-1-like 5' DNA nuclease